MQAILADAISDTAYTADAIVLAVMADAIMRGFSIIGRFCPGGFLSGGVLIQAGFYPGGFCPRPTQKGIIARLAAGMQCNHQFGLFLTFF